MNNEWQRLSLWAIVYFAVRGLMQLFNAYAVVVAGAIALSQMGLSVLEVVASVLVIVALLVFWAALYYFNFAYVQEPTRFLIREGIFSKKRTELSFSKIQNTTLKQPFYYRPFKLVVLNMETAGSRGSEVALAALSREKAESIQQAIQRFHEKGEADSSASRPDASTGGGERSSLLTRSTLDVVLHGLAHNRAWFILAIAVPVFSQMDQPVERVFEWLGVDVGHVVEHASAIWLAGLFLLAFAVLVFVLSAFSVAGAILALYDLKLFYDKGTYKRTSGLFSRYEIHVKKSRVQTLRYQQNWLDLLVKRLNMVLEPFSVAAVSEGENMMQKILLPSVTHAQFKAIAAHIYPDFDLDKVVITRVNALYLLHGFFLRVLPATVFVAVLAFGITLWQWLAPILAGVVLAGILYLRWRRIGVGVYRGFVVVRGGIIGREYFCFAAHKMQQVKFRQSLLLKRRGLATLEIVLASRTLRAPLIPEALAIDIAELCMRASVLPERSWM